MPTPRRAQARDTNEPMIRLALLSRFWRTVQHSAYDLDAMCPTCKLIVPCEVKAPQDEKRSTPALKRTHGGSLTVSQLALIANGWPLVVLRTVEDVERMIEEHRSRCARLGGDHDG